MNSFNAMTEAQQKQTELEHLALSEQDQLHAELKRRQLFEQEQQQAELERLKLVEQEYSFKKMEDERKVVEKRNSNKLAARKSREKKKHQQPPTPHGDHGNGNITVQLAGSIVALGNQLGGAIKEMGKGLDHMGNMGSQLGMGMEHMGKALTNQSPISRSSTLITHDNAVSNQESTGAVIDLTGDELDMTPAPSASQRTNQQPTFGNDHQPHHPVDMSNLNSSAFKRKCPASHDRLAGATSTNIGSFKESRVDGSACKESTPCANVPSAMNTVTAVSLQESKIAPAASLGTPSKKSDGNVLNKAVPSASTRSKKQASNPMAPAPSIGQSGGLGKFVEHVSPGCLQVQHIRPAYNRMQRSAIDELQIQLDATNTLQVAKDIGQDALKNTARLSRELQQLELKYNKEKEEAEELRRKYNVEKEEAQRKYFRLVQNFNLMENDRDNKHVDLQQLELKYNKEKEETEELQRKYNEELEEAQGKYFRLVQNFNLMENDRDKKHLDLKQACAILKANGVTFP
jgi:hypothetical protein